MGDLSGLLGCPGASDLQRLRKSVSVLPEDGNRLRMKGRLLAPVVSESGGGRINKGAQVGNKKRIGAQAFVGFSPHFGGP